MVFELSNEKLCGKKQNLGENQRKNILIYDRAPCIVRVELEFCAGVARETPFGIKLKIMYLFCDVRITRSLCSR